MFIKRFLVHCLLCVSSIMGNLLDTPYDEWNLIKRANPQQNHTVYIAMKQQNVDYLESELNDISNPKSLRYGQWKSQQEILDIVSPSQYNRNQVESWIRENRFYTIKKQLKYSLRTIFYLNQPHQIHDFGDVFKLEFPIGYLETLFETKIYQFKNKWNKIRYGLYNQSLIIPKHLENIIEFVSGLGYVIDQRVNPGKRCFVNDDDSYITAVSLQHLYNITQHPETDLLPTSQAPVEYQDDTCISQEDFNDFMTSNNLKNITMLKKNIIGDCNLSTPFPDTEASLDIQYQAAVNPNATQMYVSVKEWLYEFTVDLFNSTNPPLVNSMSWGWAESEQCDPSVFSQCYINASPEVYSKRTNVEYMKLSLRGITLVASSGDAGSPSRINEICNEVSTPLNPVFPTSSPWVTSVGGTYVINATVMPKTKATSEICRTNNCIVNGTERNCHFDAVGWTAGGGFSNFFSRPYWQVDAIEHYLQSNVTKPPQKYFNQFGRAYPDVSLVAHNYLVYVDGEIETVDGTSASAPAFSGMISRWNSLRKSLGKSSLGPIGPLLYQMAKECPNCFKDVTEGSNNSTENANCEYGYTATSGYDPVYGLGLPNYGYMYEYIKQL